MFWRFNITSVFWIAVIFLAVIIPGKDLPREDLMNSDKAFHVVMFAILSFQVAVGLKRQTRFRKLRHYAEKFSAVFGIVYGAITEVIQGLFVQGRQADLFDFVANVVGVMIGLFIFRGIYFGFKKNKIYNEPARK